MFKGIDVSVHNGTINWKKVKEAGIQFAIIRAGYGKTKIDKQFKKNITEALKAGIKVGVYWFSYAYTEEMAKQEAKSCLAAIESYKIEYPVAFDFEYDSVRYAKTKGVTITKELASKLVDAFCSEVQKAGYYAMNYANKQYIRNMFTDEITKKYDLWYARPEVSKPDFAVNLWQNSFVGKVPGIPTDVDLNIAYVDYAEIISQKKLNKLNELTNEEIIDEAIKNGFITSKNYWLQVLNGKQTPDPNYIRTIFERANKIAPE